MKAVNIASVGNIFALFPCIFEHSERLFLFFPSCAVCLSSFLTTQNKEKKKKEYRESIYLLEKLPKEVNKMKT